MNAPRKLGPSGPRECPACGRAVSERELMMVPDAVRVLRAYNQLDPNEQQLILDLVENIAVDRRRPGLRPGRRALQNS
jgi:hypothetical protein